MAWTKEKRAEYMKNWRAEHKEHIKEYRHKYYLFNPINNHPLKYKPSKEKARQYANTWRENNREQYNAYMREYRKRKALEALRCGR